MVTLSTLVRHRCVICERTHADAPPALRRAAKAWTTDARTRTGDPFNTSDGQLPLQSARVPSGPFPSGIL